MENKEKHFISAVIYVRNAEDEIEKFLTTIIEFFQNCYEYTEIICVNDFSTDNSVNIIKRVSKTADNTNISIVNMGYFHGLEIAMNAGVDLAIGDFVLEFDSTYQDFDISEIIKIYHLSLDGYDIVSASPNRKQRLSSNLFYFILDKFSYKSFKLYSENFRILSRRAINRISSMNKTIPYRKVTYACSGLKTYNVFYNVVNNCREAPKIGKVEKKYRRNLAINTLILFTEMGYRFSITMTTIMMLVAIVMGIYSLIIYILSTPVEGWTTIILFLAFAFFGLFGILTIIIKYLQILVDLVFKRKRYNFDSIEKLTN